MRYFLFNYRFYSTIESIYISDLKVLDLKKKFYLYFQFKSILSKVIQPINA